MSELLGRAAGSRYAEAPDARFGALERACAGVARLTGLDGSGARHRARFVAEVSRAAAEFEALAPDAIHGAAAEVGRALRVRGLRDAPVARAFALVRVVCTRTLGLRPGEAELLAARAALGARVAELEPADRRATAALVAAATAALAGLRVHLLAADGAVARRRFERAAGVFGALGLEAGCVGAGDALEARRAAYRCQVVFAGARDVAFDYLRDRLVLNGRPGSLALEVEALAGQARLGRLLLGGLHCAIVEDADRVLVDDAAAPLAILGAERVPGLTDLCRQALDVAAALAPDADYAPAAAGAPLAFTTGGERKLEAHGAALGGAWKGAERRRLLAATALAALRELERDRDYVVTGAGVVLSDAAAADHAEGSVQALQRMLELKEGFEPGGGRRTLARLGTERFFRRYLRLGGFVGARPGVERPLAESYGLAVERFPGAAPVAPAAGIALVRDAEDKVGLAVERAASWAAAGLPVLVVASLPDTERAVAAAIEGSDAGALVTVVRESAFHALPVPDAPRHVVLVDLLPTRWAQARTLVHAGAWGTVETVASLDEPLVASFAGAAADRLAEEIERSGEPVCHRRAHRFVALVQRRAERAAARARADLHRVEDYLGEALAFTGRRL